MKKNKIIFTAIIAFCLLIASTHALAAQGHPEPWQLGLQDAASTVMEKIYNLHNFLLAIITVISVFVLALILYVCVKFNRKRNPRPSTVTHNTKLEIIWTTIPVLILIIIAFPSVSLLYFQENPPEEPEMTIKVVGYQWYWGYEYPDNKDISFESYIIRDNDLREGQIRLLEVDNRVVLPVDTTIRVQVTAADVIHAWAVPALGIKIDAVPGRLNETWVKITKPGVYRGQCSELCGKDHGFMPIVVEAVSKESFKKWASRARQKFSYINNKENPRQIALNLNY